MITIIAKTFYVLIVLAFFPFSLLFAESLFEEDDK